MRSVAPQFDCGPPGMPPTGPAADPRPAAPPAPGFFLKNARISCARSRDVPCSTSAEPLQVDSQAELTNVPLSAEISIGPFDCGEICACATPAAAASASPASASPAIAARQPPIVPARTPMSPNLKP